jgi:hypothetical protein
VALRSQSVCSTEMKSTSVSPTARRSKVASEDDMFPTCPADSRIIVPECR